MARGKMHTCKTCGHEIANSAKVCPNCGAKQKGGKLKTILIVFAVLVLIGAFAGGGKSKDKEADGSSSAAKAAQTAEQQTTEANVEEQKPEEPKPEEVPVEQPKVEEPKVEEVAAEEPQQSLAETLIRDDFKQAMDSYEAFFDEYVEFMQLYKQDPTNAELLMQYSDMLARESTMLKEFDEWESSDMSTAETAYYLEVHSRIYAKLASVM